MNRFLTRLTLAAALLGSASLALPAMAKQPTPAPKAEIPLVEGKQFIRVPNGVPFSPSAGKIEVVEVFSYMCGHCADFEPAMSAFTPKLPKDVVVRYVPAAFNAPWEPYARAYEVAKILGAADRTHSAVFKALHRDGALPMNNVQPSELAAFYGKYGVSPQKFLALYNSDAVNKALESNGAWIERMQVPGTPTIYVNGTFMPVGRSAGEVLTNTAILIRQIRNKTIR